MGTYYEVRCMDCDELGGVYADREPDAARAAVEIAPVLAACASPFTSMEILSPVSVFLGWGDNIKVDLAFFSRHAGHRMTVADGSGSDLDQCREWLSAPEARQCALPRDHAGGCSPHGPHRREVRMPPQRSSCQFKHEPRTRRAHGGVCVGAGLCPAYAAPACYVSEESPYTPATP